ncbi:MAG: hypothetical protein PHP28_07380 [Actinomycetota bacterium]|nr:hypothetical protein [Actinomycetota bacterium]MDD5667785.1 hypothetical protein [Actinomycetota bacterium]
MASQERSLVRGMAIDAWKDVWGHPAIWLLLAASSIPLAFLDNFFLPSLYTIPAFSQTVYMALQLIGYCLCFAVLFLFWCMAVFFFDDEVRGKGKLSYRGAYARMTGWARPSLWSGLVVGLVRVFALMAAQIVLSIVMSFLVSGGTTDTSLRILYYVYSFLNFVVADLVIVLVVLVPQMLCLEGGMKVEEVLRASYRLVRERYRDAFILLIIPDLIAGVFYLGAAMLLGEFTLGIYVAPLLLLVVALLEGGKTAFLAAAYNRLYYHILEEEKKKKKSKGGKKSGAGRPAAKKPAGKGSGGKGSGGKQVRKK